VKEIRGWDKSHTVSAYNLYFVKSSNLFILYGLMELF
ncbi:hypothetical protein SAMN05192582_10051, partial [Bacteroides ovatus]